MKSDYKFSTPQTLNMWSAVHVADFVPTISVDLWCLAFQMQKIFVKTACPCGKNLSNWVNTSLSPICLIWIFSNFWLAFIDQYVRNLLLKLNSDIISSLYDVSSSFEWLKWILFNIWAFLINLESLWHCYRCRNTKTE